MHIMRHRKAHLLVGLAVALLLSACSFNFPYKIDVQQGNHITNQMAENVKEGMTKDQVLFNLGTPLLQDIFHKNRWDFIFRFTPGARNSDARQSHSLTIFFNEEGLVSKVLVWEALPDEVEPVVILIEPPQKAGDKEKVTIDPGKTESASPAQGEMTQKPADVQPESQTAPEKEK